jgi:hypothetical protein
VLERAALRPASPRLEEIQFRAITLAPRNGVRVLQDRAPVAAPTSAPASGVAGEAEDAQPGTGG